MNVIIRAIHRPWKYATYSRNEQQRHEMFTAQKLNKYATYSSNEQQRHEMFSAQKLYISKF